MPKNPHSPRPRRALSIVSDDPLPGIRIDSVGTVPMTDEQYTAAVHALAALIETWRAAQACLPSPHSDNTEWPLAA
ncbi:MAG TPA: hypothetical protein VGL26_09590 [Jatrophihabitans sp.]